MAHDAPDDDTQGGAGRGGVSAVPILTAPAARLAAEERTTSKMMDVIMALWMRPTGNAQQGPRASDLASNRESVNAWLQSMEEST